MKKAFLTFASLAVLVMISGCAAIGRYSKPEDGGQRVVIGLISIDAVSDGYPMIPLYSGFKINK